MPAGVGFGAAPQPQRALTRDDFETLSLCGSGEYGRVLMVRCVFNSQIYAMKVRPLPHGRTRAPAFP